MSSFSTMSCYAALSACTGNDILSAYARMVCSLIQEKHYETCDAKQLSLDFQEKYGFSLPYHPMLTVMNECIKLKFLKSVKGAHYCIPDYEVIDKENFQSILLDKEKAYLSLENEFSTYILEKYSIVCAPEEINKKIVSFFEHYSLDDSLGNRLDLAYSNDFLFADFIIYCLENNKTDIISYLNEYIVGCSLSQIFLYCEKPENYTSKRTNVYLDTNVVFRILGISSTDLEGYKDFVQNLRQLGMHVKIYEHTFSEIIGLIERSKQWIGNPDFDVSIASETAYYFVRNNWTTERISAYSAELRITLEKKYGITIESTTYPRAEDIRTITEESIKDRIVAQYQEGRPYASFEEKEQTIDLDAKSIFFTQHKNNAIVPYHINDVRNIFITTNQALAKVGYGISYDLAANKEYFIPVVMTDINWGTLLWFNSPAKVSSINRLRLISAAYAAFRPSPELVKRLSDSLRNLSEKDDITPEQCYLLKVSPVAQKILARKTINDPERFTESTPLEILQEIRSTAYTEGSESRQREINELTRERDIANHNLEIEKRQRKIEEYNNTLKKAYADMLSYADTIGQIDDQLSELASVKETINRSVKKRIKIVRWLFAAIAVALIVLAFVLAYKYSWFVSTVPLAFSLLLIVWALWKNEEITILSIMSKIEKSIRNKQNKLRRYSEDAVSSLQEKKVMLESRQKDTKEVIKKTKVLLELETKSLSKLDQ